MSVHLCLQLQLSSLCGGCLDPFRAFEISPKPWPEIFSFLLYMLRYISGSNSLRLSTQTFPSSRPSRPSSQLALSRNGTTSLRPPGWVLFSSMGPYMWPVSRFFSSASPMHSHQFPSPLPLPWHYGVTYYLLPALWWSPKWAPNFFSLVHPNPHTHCGLLFSKHNVIPSFFCSNIFFDSLLSTNKP